MRNIMGAASSKPTHATSRFKARQAALERSTRIPDATAWCNSSRSHFSLGRDALSVCIRHARDVTDAFCCGERTYAFVSPRRHERMTRAIYKSADELPQG